MPDMPSEDSELFSLKCVFFTILVFQDKVISSNKSLL